MERDRAPGEGLPLLRAQPGKNQAEGGRILGNPACQQPPFGLLCQTAPPRNFEDEKKFEHFFNVALQTDYLHGRLEPRFVAVLDVSGEFAFVTQTTYRFTDSLLGTAAFIVIEGAQSRARRLPRPRPFQFRLTYQLN